MFVGVDGCKKGWVAIAITDAGFASAHTFATFTDLMAQMHSSDVIGVDMPIGLLEKGDREADGAARDFLSGQASSVFNAPPRAVLAASEYQDANRVSREINGKGITKQTFNIVKKIIEVDVFAKQPNLHEVHPEISFRLMAGDGLLLKKKAWGGLHRRLRLLKSNGILIPADLGDANLAGIDDVVDAAAAAWSARRIAAGQAQAFPAATNQVDQSGRKIVIQG